MHISKEDIAYIRKDLGKRGIVHHSLLEELVDHVCSQLEIELKEGIPLKKAYENVLKEVNANHIAEIQNDTFRSENYNKLLMLRNTVRMMMRNLRKYRTYSIVNIIGLFIGFSCFIVIALYVNHELGFDKIFSKSSSLYRVTMSSTVGGLTNRIPTSFPAIGPEVTDRFSNISKYTRIINYKYSRLVPTFRVDDKIFYEEKVIFADSSFFDLFDFPFIEGNARRSLLNPNSVVITKAIAQKYFGIQSALGKHLNFNNKTDVEVTGVLEDLPSNTHLQFDFLIPMSNIANSGMFRSAQVLESWNVDWFWTYLIIPDQNSILSVESEINKIADEKIPEYRKENSAVFYLQSLGDIHLRSEFDYNTDITQNGDIKNLFIFISIGIIALVISAINFINISMATATRRYKEIGISKVLGALKSHLRIQFLFESVGISLIALLLSFIFLEMSFPLFEKMLGIPLRIGLSDGRLISLIIFIAVFIGILSGLYPAFFVSSFEPQRVLKGVWKPGKGGANFRKILVGAQISISIFLIVGTLVIWKQLHYIQNKSLGFDKDQIIMLPIRGTNIPQSYHTFKNRLLTESSIIGVSSVSEPIGREVQFMSFSVEGKENPQFIKILNVTHDFIKTMGLKIIQGRDFSRDHSTDSVSGFIINESAAKSLGWKDPIGKMLDHSFRPIKQGNVIGVVRDFNFEPLQKHIDPIVLWFGSPSWYVAVRIEKGKSLDALGVIEANWKKIEPEKPFSFYFLSQAIQHVYEKEERLSNAFFVFSILSIFTAMLGLYGLISFVAEQRLSEICVRKVMGASVENILYLISREYMILVLFSFVIITPIIYFVATRWLENFAFRISWDNWYLIFGLLVSAAIVTLTVISKTITAARSNPAEVLRNE